jgi:outer membrane protein TolC
LERAGYYPTVFLSTGFQFARAQNRDEQTNPFASDDFNYIRPVGVLGLRWDLNFLMTGAKVDQARAELDRLQAQQRDAATGLQLEIRRAYREVVQAKDTMQATQEGRKAGRALLILTVSNFDLGIGEAEELFKGLGSYTESSTDYLRAVHDYNVALGVLSQSVNREVTTLQY